MAVYRCLRCDVEFRDKPSARRRYCSHLCSDSAQREKSREERFWAKVNKDGPEVMSGSPCWIFEASGRYGGYAGFWNGQTVVGAHQFAFTLQHGAMPLGKEVCHRCDIRRCVRGDHLFPGTHRENMRDMRAKGRAPVFKAHAGSFESGEKHRRRKLSATQVEEIKARRATKEPAQSIADSLGIVRDSVYHIALGMKRKNG